MPKISIQTTQRVVPMIYAYTTPEIKRHDGWTKIGYTDKQTVEERVRQQVHTADVDYQIEWKGRAVYEDESGDSFTDHDFRAYLRKLGVEIKPTTEWCCIDPPKAQQRFFEYRANHGILSSDDVDEPMPYTLRAEQEKCAQATADYYRAHPNSEFLWNCKPRFGKTLTAYDFIKRIHAEKVLIVTNRPAIANSWYADYEKFLSLDSHYRFVSDTDSLQGKKLVMSYSDYIRDRASRADSSRHAGAEKMGLIEFVSLQDLKGGYLYGGEYNKLEHLSKEYWDVLIIDEAHEGVDTYRTDVAFDRIRRKFTLHLSGTPFRALANDKFPDKAIFNWTYAEEQAAKRDWAGEESNPYADLPRLNLFTYQMSEIIKEELIRGIELEGETTEYAFDLNEFFSTNAAGRFVYESSVDRFLGALTSQEKFPFSTDELRQEIKHSFWLLDRIDSAKELTRKLKAHPVFKDYEIVAAYGDGRVEDDDPREKQKSYDRVKDAIAHHEYTITLSVGQLTTGVTIPEWTAVLMLCNWRSPAQYMQAAFRAQNPCVFHGDGQLFKKENAYVFDFDPARTLDIYERFANDLSTNTVDGRGDIETRRSNIKELLNFFPVVGEDEQGEMIPLDAEKVLSIPRKIRSQEVVKRGFMSDFLFQNITNVFRAPKEVFDILEKFTPVQEPKNKLNVTPDTADELSLDEQGEVNPGDEIIIGTERELFGEKVYAPQVTPDTLYVPPTEPLEQRESETKQKIDALKKAFHESTINQMLKDAAENPDHKLRASTKRRLESDMSREADRTLDRAYENHKIAMREIEQEHEQMLELAQTSEERAEVHQEYEQKLNEEANAFNQNVMDALRDLDASNRRQVAKTVETEKREAEKKDYETRIKDHLRGFSRTIPSFLMAYGDDSVTLATFDRIIPANVFLEVTSITLEQFIFLRDGGDYYDEEAGETKHFDGHLFEPVVFDDSIKEFLRLRVKLADYFEESNTEDIFDYIPPQKTNQIFTPKWVVKKMVDMLEEENPGCFDMPDKTFADLYMKSGLYIAEIVKRLYQSKELQRIYPDRHERLHHIFAKQVYGLAPTEIIYKIATNFILGFDEGLEIKEHHFKQLDSLEYAKNGTLEAELDKAFGS